MGKIGIVAARCVTLIDGKFARTLRSVRMIDKECADIDETRDRLLWLMLRLQQRDGMMRWLIVTIQRDGMMRWLMLTIQKRFRMLWLMLTIQQGDLRLWERPKSNKRQENSRTPGNIYGLEIS